MFRLMETLAAGQVYIIAEMSANHGGKLENALEIVRQAARAGADCVKIQTYTADTLTIDCDNEYFQIKDGLWAGRTLYDLYQEAGTPWEWQERIKRECEACGVDFLSTPFDNTAVDFLEELGCEAYKIASFELVDIPLIEYAASKGKPMIISCGMGSVEEIQEAVDACKRQGNDQVVLLKCCSEYPANYEDMRLRTIPDMAERFKVSAGLSDHSMGSLAAVVGVSLGACVVEKHFCLNRELKTPDSAFSMEPEEFARMVEDIRGAEKLLSPSSYELSEKEQKSMVFRRSLFTVRDIREGERFTPENIRSIRPGYGIKPKFYRDILGGKVRNNISRGTPIGAQDIKEELSFRKAVESDRELLLEWANEKETRSQSFQIHQITPEEHNRWFWDAMRDENIRILIFCLDEVPIGSMRFSIEGMCATLSYNISHCYRGHGFGQEMIRMAVAYATQYLPVATLEARTKKGNFPSRNILLSNGFELMENSCRHDELIFIKTLRASTNS